MLLKEEKAQTAIEYLLLIAGVVIAATAIGLYLKQAATSAVEGTTQTQG